MRANYAEFYVRSIETPSVSGNRTIVVNVIVGTTSAPIDSFRIVTSPTNEERRMMDDLWTAIANRVRKELGESFLRDSESATQE
jgi:hypothetical protein